MVVASSSRVLVQGGAGQTLRRSAARPAYAAFAARSYPLRNRQLLDQSRSLSRSSSVHASSPVSDPATGSSPLSWERYLKLRKQRRLAGALTTVPTTLAAAFASGTYFLTQEIDPTSSPIAGIDPVYVYALLTLGCTGLGYLAGPSLGTSVWSLAHRGQAKEIEEKDKKFYEHIVRNRVDPSRQTMQNRLPDYYGEKIGSISDYRQWLRDQATFREKAAHGVEDDERNL